MVDKRTLRRGSIRREDCIFVGAWVPAETVAAVDLAAETLDSDRSKFLRIALKEKIAATAKQGAA